MGFEGNVYACKNTTNASQVHTEDEKTNCSHLTCGRELVLCLHHFYQVESVGNTSVSKAFLNIFFLLFYESQWGGCTLPTALHHCT